MGDKSQIQGEGNYEAGRKFQEDERKFVKGGPVEQKAREAADALDGPEAAELERARARNRGQGQRVLGSAEEARAFRALVISGLRRVERVESAAGCGGQQAYAVRPVEETACGVGAAVDVEGHARHGGRQI